MTNITIELQDQKEELTKATDLLEKVKREYNMYKKESKGLKKISIPKDRRKFLVYMVDKILGATGEISITRFDVREKLEKEYTMKYLQSPALGKTLFLEHYASIHAPYDKIKNKCFDLLTKLDKDGKIVDQIDV